MDQVRHMKKVRRPDVMSWVPVTDDHGQVRMEMRWHVGERKGHKRATLTSRAAAA